MSEQAATTERVSESPGGFGLFPLGRLVATPAAIDALAESGETARPYLRRHLRGDWGELSAHDRLENDGALGHRLRLLSAYSLQSGVKIWLITEADRSATTILLPDDY
ncbi:MAG TPA: hypothetical protein VM285_17560 [Polyangia bacterium]|nr:hypothetical protein [Polyangia bacterium]